VLDALRATAARTQTKLRAELDAAGIPYESRYIANTLVVKGDAKLVSSLTARPEVAYVGASGVVPAPEPVESGPAPAGANAAVWNMRR
jgi:hypothetical protein